MPTETEHKSSVPISPADSASDVQESSTWLVPVLTMATLVTMLHAMALGPLMPVIAKDLNTSVSLLGQVPALSMLLGAMLGLVAGPLADRFGLHRALLWSLLAVLMSSVGMAWASSFVFLLLAALFGSIGRAIVQPVAVVIVGNRFSGDRQRRAISWVMAGVTGAVIAGIPTLTTVAGALGWRAALLGLALIVAILIPLVHRGLGPAATPDGSSASFDGILSAYRPLIHHRPTLFILGTTLTGSAGIWVMATYLGAFYTERYGYTTQQVGWVYFVPGITLFAGSLAAGGRIGGLPLRPLVILSRVVTGFAIAALFSLSIPAIVGVGLLAVQGITTGVSTVAVVFLLMKESPAGRATTLTLNAAALSLGTALGSTLGGLLLAVASFSLLGLSSLLLSCTAALLIWLSRNSPGNGPTTSVDGLSR